MVQLKNKTLVEPKIVMYETADRDENTEFIYFFIYFLLRTTCKNFY